MWAKTVITLISDILFFSILFTFAVITYPLIIFVSFSSVFVDHYLKKLKKIRRSISSFQHKHTSLSLERTLSQIIELKLREESDIPVELVQAYVYLSKTKVYEIDVQNYSIHRIFEYDVNKDLIKITILDLGKDKLFVRHKQIIDMSEAYSYYNYLPEWVTKE